MTINNLLNIKSRDELREWLMRNHDKETECWVVVKRGRPVILLHKTETRVNRKLQKVERRLKSEEKSLVNNPIQKKKPKGK